MRQLKLSIEALEALEELHLAHTLYPLDGLLKANQDTRDILDNEDLDSTGEYLAMRYLIGDDTVELVEKPTTYIVHSGDLITLSTGETIVLDDLATIKGHPKE